MGSQGRSPVSYTHLDVYKRQGVGAGIIINGEIYSGSNNAGGEIGHTVIEVDLSLIHILFYDFLTILFLWRSNSLKIANRCIFKL